MARESQGVLEMLYEHDHQLLESFKKPAETPSKKHTDLMVRIQGGEAAALRELMDIEGRTLGAVIQQIVKCSADVDEVLQEVYLDVWNKAHQFDPAKGNGFSWVVTIARRRAIDRVRRRTCYQRVGERYEQTLKHAPQIVEMQSVQYAADGADKAEIFEAIFSAIPVDQAKIVRLTYYGGLSQRDISKHLGIPLGTVKTRLELGMKKFRASLLSVAGESEWLCAA